MPFNLVYVKFLSSRSRSWTCSSTRFDCSLVALVLVKAPTSSTVPLQQKSGKCQRACRAMALQHSKRMLQVLVASCCFLHVACLDSVSLSINSVFLVLLPFHLSFYLGLLLTRTLFYISAHTESYPRTIDNTLRTRCFEWRGA